MLITMLLCKSRSSMAAAMVVSEKMSPHEATDLLVVKITEPLRYRRDMTWKRAAASSVGMDK